MLMLLVIVTADELAEMQALVQLAANWENAGGVNVDQ